MTRPDITPDRVLAEEARIAFADPRAVYDAAGEPKPPHCLDEDTARALAAVEVVESTTRSGETTVRYKYKFWDKRAALDRLARHLGLAGPAPDPEEGDAEPVTFVMNLGGAGADAETGREDEAEDSHGER
jgi:phage terminase small subunit